MRHIEKIIFKDIKSCIIKAIKESCYKFDARFYNIANQVEHILTFSLEPGVEGPDGLSKIVDKTIKDTVGVGCDLSVIVKGVLIGAFRSRPFLLPEMRETFRVLIKEILRAVFKYKGDIKQAVDGLLAGIVIISNEYKLNVQENLTAASEDILSAAKLIDPKFADDIKEAFPNPDDPS